MGPESKSEGGQARFAPYVDAITMVLGHADRAAPLRVDAVQNPSFFADVSSDGRPGRRRSGLSR